MTDAPHMLSLTELENAATDVIRILQRLTEFSHTRIAFAGEVALWRYLPQERHRRALRFLSPVPCQSPRVSSHTPAGALEIGNVQGGNLPYISRADLGQLRRFYVQYGSEVTRGYAGATDADLE
ncbi:hypothetical protein CPLU01_05230 [Colletotrichum plurivorum]|uniref:Uncharacterized protein n=1 Tax=Colletotrichum plurivorum TaxID=2175906 RepID=A0A8H6KM86_9PEZI|nr:hypothetical protein CPLU01_05230 [Colletotrichum plurivorum]